MRKQMLEELGLLPRWERRSLSSSVQHVAEPEVSEQPILPSQAATASAIVPQPPLNEAVIAKMSWQNLQEIVSTCQQCALAAERTQTVFGVGDREADVFLVGEGPGSEEDRQGEPFVGPAGKLLDAMLASIELRRGQGVYIANIVKCRPPQNRNPQPEEARVCLTYLRRQLALVKPRLIVALGGVAAANLLQNDVSVGKLRQRLHDYEGTPLVVTYHPAYLLRAPSEKRKSWDDLRLIRRLIASTP
ncbi:uracil-DNA glycosylase [Candidatus Persebacteraceae bacterium Df01]|jgi:DNA polymerase|uniref:Type-4 uracil-DNA glycosylase n=1 Tax=Candidatus Doriopsillibacter californiensis TaxID=2970740 RepID=A0ABT7QL24_9GAMM|nr:uracil-DNA glycosylase [Candidatus Persebacteraceae bacterium Df01]